MAASSTGQGAGKVTQHLYAVEDGARGGVRNKPAEAQKSLQMSGSNRFTGSQSDSLVVTLPCVSVFSVYW